MKYCKYLLLFSVWFPTLLRAQTAGVSSNIDVSNIVIGDQLHLFLEGYYQPKQEQLVWCNIPDTFNHLEVVERSPIDTIQRDGTTHLKQSITITGFDSGAYKIPAFSFAVKDSSGVIKNLYADSFFINVATIAVDTTKPFKSIKDIVPVSVTWTDYIPQALIAIALIALAIGIWLYLKRRRSTASESAKGRHSETYWQRSQRLLDELDAEALWQKGEVKAYYTRLSDILRDYIERRFGIPAKEKTTDEINTIARKQPDMRPYRRAIKEILNTADMAKFAKAQPLPEQHISAMNGVRDFILITTPKPIVNATASQQKA